MWKLTWIVVILFTLPAVFNFILGLAGVENSIEILMHDSVFASMITLIWGAYLMSDYKVKSLGASSTPDIPSSPKPPQQGEDY